MKTVYQARRTTRDGKSLRIEYTVDTLEEAEALIKKAKKQDKSKTKRVGSIGVTLEDTGQEEPYDIVGYKIVSRQMSPWTEEVSVCTR